MPNINVNRKVVLNNSSFQNTFSYLFDGVNERININAVGTSLATNTTGTFSAWIKLIDATPANQNLISAFGMGDGTDMVQFFATTTGVLRATVVNSGVTQWDTDTDSAQFTDNTWAHVALVQNGVSPLLYVNGVAPAQTFITTTDKTQWFNNLILNNGRIGCRFWTAVEGDGGLPFNGNIDEVGFFNTNLTATQIVEIYNSGKPKNLLVHSASQNLISYFRMGDGDSFDGTNWTLFDKKGTNDGTSVNMENGDLVYDTP